LAAGIAGHLLSANTGRTEEAFGEFVRWAWLACRGRARSRHSAALLDYLVGTAEQRERDSEAERLGGL
jgi:hypothetical protein